MTIIQVKNMFAHFCLNLRQFQFIKIENFDPTWENDEGGLFVFNIVLSKINRTYLNIILILYEVNRKIFTIISVGNSKWYNRLMQ